MSETDKTISTEEPEILSEEVEQSVQEIETDSGFEISDEVKERSKKFFNFSSKPKKEKRKYESFEIVKTYTPKTTKKPKEDNSFNNIVDVSNNFEAVEESVSTTSDVKKTNVKVQMRTKGKIILIAISFLIIILTGFSIFNAIKINNLNSSINNLNNQITIEDANLKKAIKELGALTSEEKIKEESGNLNLSEIEDSKILDVELYERKPIQKIGEKSNWFSKLCDFLSNIFGG